MFNVAARTLIARKHPSIQNLLPCLRMLWLLLHCVRAELHEITAPSTSLMAGREKLVLYAPFIVCLPVYTAAELLLCMDALPDVPCSVLATTQRGAESSRLPDHWHAGRALRAAFPGVSTCIVA